MERYEEIQGDTRRYKEIQGEQGKTVPLDKIKDSAAIGLNDGVDVDHDRKRACVTAEGRCKGDFQLHMGDCQLHEPAEGSSGGRVRAVDTSQAVEESEQRTRRGERARVASKQRGTERRAQATGERREGGERGEGGERRQGGSGEVIAPLRVQK